MNALYPLKFKPVFDDRVWGGENIRTVMGLDFSPMKRCAEAWVLSGVEGRQTIVSNGFLAGNEINELVEVYMDELLGERVFENSNGVFPLLFKFIDARQWLSVQVHPDDELARKRGMPNGKTEMWYIIDAEHGSELISGFRKKVTTQQFQQHLRNKNLAEILNYEPVRKDDVFFMPAGRIHSLGPGVLLAEIQQTSDATYRIYDWDRIDENGKGRELHAEDALAAIDFDVYPDYRTPYSARLNETAELVSCPYFTTNLLELARPLEKDYSELDSFVAYICLDGATALKFEAGERMELRKGEVALVPACMDRVELYPDPNVKILEVYIS